MRNPNMLQRMLELKDTNRKVEQSDTNGAIAHLVVRHVVDEGPAVRLPVQGPAHGVNSRAGLVLGRVDLPHLSNQKCIYNTGGWLYRRPLSLVASLQPTSDRSRMLRATFEL